MISAKRIDPMDLHAREIVADSVGIREVLTIIIGDKWTVGDAANAEALIATSEKLAIDSWPAVRVERNDRSRFAKQPGRGAFVAVAALPHNGLRPAGRGQFGEFHFLSVLLSYVRTPCNCLSESSKEGERRSVSRRRRH
jgi:hypothetical protein